MDFEFTSEQLEFIKEVEEFLDANDDPEVFDVTRDVYKRQTYSSVHPHANLDDSSPAGASFAGGQTDHPLFGAMESALDGRELLGHPFYLRWQAGELTADELARYAVNYRVFEAALPVVLTAVVEQLRHEGEVEACLLYTSRCV